MERETGIEPATSSLGSWRSTAELLPLTGEDNQSLASEGAGNNLTIGACRSLSGESLQRVV